MKKSVDALLYAPVQPNIFQRIVNWFSRWLYRALVNFQIHPTCYNSDRDFNYCLVILHQFIKNMIKRIFWGSILCLGVVLIFTKVAQAVQFINQEASSGSLVVNQPVDDTLFVVGGNLFNINQIEINAEVKGDVIATGQAIKINGLVEGNVFATTNLLSIDGQIHGNLFVLATTVVIGNKAQIAKDAYIWSQDIQVSPQAVIKGNLRTPTAQTQTWGQRLNRHILATLSLLMLGFIVIMLAPKSFKKIVDASLQGWGQSVLVGALSLIIIPLVAVIAIVMRIGLPVGLIIFGLFIIELYLTTIVVGASLGQILSQHRLQLIWSMVIGVLLIQALRLIVGLNQVVTIAVVIWGLGAILLGKKSLFHHFRHDL